MSSQAKAVLSGSTIVAKCIGVALGYFSLVAFLMYAAVDAVHISG